jgi:hypothetical protein
MKTMRTPIEMRRRIDETLRRIREKAFGLQDTQSSPEAYDAMARAIRLDAQIIIDLAYELGKLERGEVA